MVKSLASLTQLEEDVQILLARQNPNDFCRYVMGWEQKWFHEEWQYMLYHEEWNPLGLLSALVLAPRDHGKAVLVDSLLTMADGSRKNAKEIAVGDTVISITDNLKLSSSKVVRIFPQGGRPCIKFTFRSGRVFECDENHLLRKVTGWEDARNLTVGDRLATPRRYSFTLPESNSYEMRLLGYLIGDGGIGHGVSFGTGSFFVNVDFARCCRNLSFPYSIRRGDGTLEFNVNQPSTTWLRSHNLFGTNSGTKFVPEIVFRSSNHSVAQFLSAYFDCDAEVPDPDLKGYCEFYCTTKSERLARDVQHLLLRLDVRSSIHDERIMYKGELRHYFTIKVWDGPSIVNLAKWVQLRHPERMRRLQRASEICSDRISAPITDNIPQEWRTLSRGSFYIGDIITDTRTSTSRSKVAKVARLQENEVLADLAHSDLFWDTIIRVENIGFHETICFQVDPHHTFITDDILSHNSSQLAVARCLWELGKNHNLRIKLIAQSDDKATDRLYEIVGHIEDNERLHKVFPELRPDDTGTWTKHKIIVDREKHMADASIEALGITSTATGGRADLEIFDDPVDFRNAIQYPAMRKVVKQAFYSVWVNLLEPEGRMIYIGTAWHNADLTHELLANENYNSKVYTAIQEDGSVLWPEKWHQAALDKRLGEIGEREFQRQFQNKALTSDETLFQREKVEPCFNYDLEFGKVYPWMVELPKYVGADLAATISRTSDWTVLFVIAYDEARKKRIPLEVVRKKLTAPDTVRHLFALQDKWNPRFVMVENNAYQNTLIQWMQEFDRSIPVKPFTTLSKADPIIGLPSLAVEFEQLGWEIPRAGEHKFACSCPMCLWLEEMETYPIGRSKDILMASWFASEPIRRKLGSGNGWKMVGNLGEVFNRAPGAVHSRGSKRRFGRRQPLWLR